MSRIVSCRTEPLSFSPLPALAIAVLLHGRTAAAPFVTVVSVDIELDRVLGRTPRRRRDPYRPLVHATALSSVDSAIARKPPPLQLVAGALSGLPSYCRCRHSTWFVHRVRTAPLARQIGPGRLFLNLVGDAPPRNGLPELLQSPALEWADEDAWGPSREPLTVGPWGRVD